MCSVMRSGTDWCVKAVQQGGWEMSYLSRARNDLLAEFPVCC